MLVCSRDLAVRISARRKARDVIDHMPQNGLGSIVENWRPLPDGQIEFVVRQVRATD